MTRGAISWLSLPPFAGSGRLTFPQRSGPYWLMALSFQVSTDATAGNRTPILLVQAPDGVEAMQLSLPAIAIPPNSAASPPTVSLFAGMPAVDAGGVALEVCTGPLPNDGYFVDPSFKVQLALLGGAAGDSVENIFAVIQEAVP